jgi:hypothetical protein
MNAWLRDHPRRADGLLAAALLVVSAPQLAAGQASAAARAVFAVVTVLLAATVVARRHDPGLAHRHLKHGAVFTAGNGLQLAYHSP